MNNFNQHSTSGDDYNEDATENSSNGEDFSKGTIPTQNQRDSSNSGKTETHLHSNVDGLVHTGTGDINVHYPPPEAREGTQSKKKSTLESILNYLSQSSIGKGIAGPLRFTLVFAFIVTSILLIRWIFPDNLADTLIGIYVLGLIIWWIAKEPD